MSTNEPPAYAAARHAEIYARAKSQSTIAELFKPSEPKASDLTFTLAPLILQEINSSNSPGPWHRPGTLISTNGVLTLDLARPTVYTVTDTFEHNGQSHPRLTYLWFYSKTSEPIAMNPAGVQGVRITLNSSGQPAFWEILTDTSGFRVFFVTHDLESEAQTEYGAPQTGRRFTLERSLAEAPGSVVARAIESGPVPMGPILYLRAETHDVSTLICRCMPAQGKEIRDTVTYQLISSAAPALRALLSAACQPHRSRLAFWPFGDDAPLNANSNLRLPKSF